MKKKNENIKVDADVLAEAVYHLQTLKVNPEVISNLKEGKLMISERHDYKSRAVLSIVDLSYKGLNDCGDLVRDEIKTFREKYPGDFIFHLILTPTKDGKLILSILYIPKDKSIWEEGRSDLVVGRALEFVYEDDLNDPYTMSFNSDDPETDNTFGTIHVRPYKGGIARSLNW